jgi:hypothetical protein
VHWSVHIPAARINSTPNQTKENCLYKVQHIITAVTDIELEFFRFGLEDMGSSIGQDTSQPG